MIPIIYESTETAFASNGLGRLRDAIEVLVSEERNGVYEASLQYPMSGANFDLIQIGRILGITHDESGDIEPFDIVSYERPINGVVTFHAVHISYRLSYKTVTASSINSLADAFTAFQSAEPDMPFTFQTDKTSSGYASAFDGLPKTVRSLMGGIEGSILDAYGGEYSYNNWTVFLHAARGQIRDFAIRYGVNMLNYEEAYDSQGTYSSVMPYWTDGTDTVLGDRVDSGNATITGRGECVPLDVSDKFESKPTKADVELEAAKFMASNSTFIPSQNIKVDFVRLQDLGYEDLGSLMQCNLCDTIRVIFPDYNSSGTFKIVKTTWNVLDDRYEEMELGQLSVTLAEALGISGGMSFSSGGGGGAAGTPTPTPDMISMFDHTAHMNSTDMTSQEVDDFVDALNVTAAPLVDYIVEQGTSGSWTYRKWNSGVAECWCLYVDTIAVTTSSAGYGGYRSAQIDVPFPFTFLSTPSITATIASGSAGAWVNNVAGSSSSKVGFYLSSAQSNASASRAVGIHAIGKWK